MRRSGWLLTSLTAGALACTSGRGASTDAGLDRAGNNDTGTGGTTGTGTGGRGTGGSAAGTGGGSGGAASQLDAAADGDAGQRAGSGGNAGVDAGGSDRPSATDAPMETAQSDGATDGPSGGDGSAALDAAGADATAARDAAGPCSVATDGGTVPCTTLLASASDFDYFCGLKPGAAGGELNCWAGESIASFYLPLTAPALAKTPPGLVQLGISNSFSDDPLFCGVDGQGEGSCWGFVGQTVALGPGLLSAVVSDYGTCTLAVDRSASCSSFLTPLPVGPHYTSVLLSEDFPVGLDDTGTVFMPFGAFPAGVYVEITTNNAERIGAVRNDGTAVSRLGTDMVVMPGSFTHLALDDSGRACGIDATGEISCWQAFSGSTAPPITTVPAGPYVQIIGGSTTFCALRRSGTTTCWGDQVIDVPAGW